MRRPGLAPAGSGGLGGPLIRLDAVLAEQAAHPVELAVHALVLGDDRLDVDACRPLLLQAQLAAIRTRSATSSAITARHPGALADWPQR